MKKKNDRMILLGERIRKLRQIKNWTQQQLGEQADISYKYIGDIERGKENPSVNVLIKIAAALNIEIIELFRFEQNTGRKQIKAEITKILDAMPDDILRQVLTVLKIFWPVQ